MIKCFVISWRTWCNSGKTNFMIISSTLRSNLNMIRWPTRSKRKSTESRKWHKLLKEWKIISKKKLKSLKEMEMKQILLNNMISHAKQEAHPIHPYRIIKAGSPWISFLSKEQLTLIIHHSTVSHNTKVVIKKLQTFLLYQVIEDMLMTGVEHQPEDVRLREDPWTTITVMRVLQLSGK